MAPRNVLERPMFGIGSFTEVEMILHDPSKALFFHARYGRFDERVSGMEVAPERAVKIVHGVVHQGATGRSALLMRMWTGPNSLTASSKTALMVSRFFEVQHQRLVPACSELGQLHTKGLKRFSVPGTNSDVCAGLCERFAVLHRCPYWLRKRRHVFEKRF